MEIFIKVAQFLLSLSILIILHEFGHFVAARLFKTRVEKFFLFFDAWGKKLFSFKKGETEYGIGWLPLGGYVKISGMIDESMDKEQLKNEPQPYEFRSKPAWQRLIIMLGGVTVNFILGILIYIMLVFVWGEDIIPASATHYGYTVTETMKQYGFQDGDQILKINGETPDNLLQLNKNLMFRDINSIEVKHSDGVTEVIKLPEDIGKVMWEKGDFTPFNPRSEAVIDTLIPESPALKAGLLKGDKIIAVNGKNIQYWDELSTEIDSSRIALQVVREKDTVLKEIQPKILNPKLKKYQLGINPDYKKAVSVQHKTYGILESISRGNEIAVNTFKDFIYQFKYVFTKKGASELGGFIAMGKIFPDTWDWSRFWQITAFLSIMLAIMNLLPIPALDGGHALFVIFEMITGKKPSDKFLEHAQIVGFVILMTLLLYANGNDVYKLIKGWF